MLVTDSIIDDIINLIKKSNKYSKIVKLLNRDINEDDLKYDVLHPILSVIADYILDHSEIEMDMYEELYGPTPEFDDNIQLGQYEINGVQLFGIILTFEICLPIYAVLYRSENKLNVYVPQEGNYWNTETKQAYGLDIKKDRKALKSRYGINIDEFDPSLIRFDKETIIKDIANHLNANRIR